ncbi:uncharacterized protein HKW66_Vig0105290 [Vigna angularis]|uniref:Transmembrane protein n=2 Tax=Phaseolus angularis TaxID=3914 RepID=A0A8T0KK15_PHAAN|nr:uncharacterized protein HKW66_Vig0105290 [Vigna angularis]BAT78901.1 hypothetical protein VIGAN_02165600 [Vigna angularis var. angularis]
MAIYGASKFMTFVAVAAIVLLMFSTVASADQPAIKLWRKLFQYELPEPYTTYPGGGGYTPPSNPSKP